MCVFCSFFDSSEIGLGAGADACVFSVDWDGFWMSTDGSQIAGYALRHEKLTTKGRQGIADRVTKLGGIIGEARMLCVFFIAFNFLNAY